MKRAFVIAQLLAAHKELLATQNRLKDTIAIDMITRSIHRIELAISALDER